jgi:hypothetical protein
MKCSECQNKGVIINDQKMGALTYPYTKTELAEACRYCDCEIGQRIRWIHGKVAQEKNKQYPDGIDAEIERRLVALSKEMIDNPS